KTIISITKIMKDKNLIDKNFKINAETLINMRFLKGK
ncbi:hypothetical protein HG1285_07749, partial [Hydrogenivirga sp. 128-5-R1-1]